jgi:hypothetical protein
METELRKAMSMLPQLDYTDPVAARSENESIRSAVDSAGISFVDRLRG